MSTKPRVKIAKGDQHVFLTINDTEYEMNPYLAKQIGDVLFKTACDVQAHVQAQREAG